MYQDFRADYDRYKAASFVQQVLRISNTFFATFTFWNIVFKPSSPQQLPWSAIQDPLLIIVTIVAGCVLTVLVLIKLSTVFHCLLLPFIAAAFAVSSQQSLMMDLCFIPGAAIVLQLILRVLPRAVRFINKY